MILTIDVGNSNIVVGCLDGGSVTHVFRLSTNLTKTEDEYASDINNILQFYNVGRSMISGAAISCVVPPLTNILKNSVKLLAGVDAVVVGAGVKTGMNILIDDPAQLAGDMASSAVGALVSYSPPLIIVDLGTAIKMTVIDKNGSFIGGAVMPGVSLSVSALSDAASLLPKVPIEAPQRCISTNTIDCMKSGAVFGTASMIDGMIGRFEAELGSSALVIATGGLAEMICRHTEHDITLDPHLILRGLGVIYYKNVKIAK